MVKIVLAIVLASSVVFSYEMDYTEETVGLVKGIKVHKEPKWVAKIELTNGKKIFFVSPKSMIEFYNHPGKWFDIGVKSEDDLKDIIVTDFTTLKPIDARSAFYVYGSNMRSPAGDDLPAFATHKAADSYAKKHNGKRIFKFEEIPEALIKLLNGRL